MIAALFASAALLSGVAILRRARWFDAVAYIAALVCVVVAIGAALGMPRPSWLGHAPGTTVLAMQLDEGRAIYLWTRAGDAAPVAFALPWDEKRAAKIHQLLQEGRARHQPVRWGNANGGGGKPGRTGTGGRPGARTGESGGSNAFGGASSAGFSLAPHTSFPVKSRP